MIDQDSSPPRTRLQKLAYCLTALLALVTCLAFTATQLSSLVPVLIPATRTPSPTATSPPFPTPTPIPPSTQLEVFENVWETVNDKYVYPDFNGLDWNAVHEEYRKKIESGLSSKAFYDAMTEMVARLGDDHSSFMPPLNMIEIGVGQSMADYMDDADIGAYVVDVPERQRMVIIAVAQGSGGAAVGLKPRDSILAVNDEPIMAADGSGKWYLLLGAEGTSLKLTIQTPGQEQRNVRVTRHYLENIVWTVPYQVLVTPAGKLIGYMALVTFNEETLNDQVQNALKTMSVHAPLDGLILDVRMNQGGRSNMMSSILSLFAEGTAGTITTRSTQYSFQIGPINDIYGSSHFPLVVLIDKSTYSNGETFAGILCDIGRAYLIGENTGGHVELLNVHDLIDGSQLLLAEYAYHPINHPDEDWKKTGIVPDLTVVSNWAEVTVEDDPAVQAALAYYDVFK